LAISTYLAHNNFTGFSQFLAHTIFSIIQSLIFNGNRKITKILSKVKTVHKSKTIVFSTFDHFSKGISNSTIKIADNISIIFDEFDSIRLSNILLFKQLSDKELLLKGKSGLGEVSVLALGYFMCGHAQHHVNIIKERYL
jgi:hypothetical protein